MITTPEIDRLNKKRDAHRKAAQKLERQLFILRAKERERLRQAKAIERAEKKAEESEVKWSDRRSMANQINRLRVLLAESMKANGCKTSDIEKATGIGKKHLRVCKKKLERAGEIQAEK